MPFDDRLLKIVFIGLLLCLTAGRTVRCEEAAAASKAAAGTATATAAATATTTVAPPSEAEAMEARIAALKPGLFAMIKTSRGLIVCELYPDKAPLTVSTFVNLAEGTIPWIHPKTGKYFLGRYFDGQIFHRVIPGFMIQGGDPLGTGTGGPGFQFKDEFNTDLKFDRPGRLAMANSGPNTNGSQFFITHVPYPSLNNKHTIFGQVIEGQDVVDAIGAVARDHNNKPTEDVKIEKVWIMWNSPVDELKQLLRPGEYAVIETSLGRIMAVLSPEVAPEGVANFVGLASGAKEWTDPKTGEKVKRPYYDGLTFHRVIPNFMIQGGDPLGDGRGGPGYKFKNEVSDKVIFDRPGRLAYANAGPDTNGSQFFITHNAYPSLDGKYTIFGQVIIGTSVADLIAAMPRDATDKPLRPVIIRKVTVFTVEPNPQGAN